MPSKQGHTSTMHALCLSPCSATPLLLPVPTAVIKCTRKGQWSFSRAGHVQGDRDCPPCDLTPHGGRRLATPGRCCPPGHHGHSQGKVRETRAETASTSEHLGAPLGTRESQRLPELQHLGRCTCVVTAKPEGTAPECLERPSQPHDPPSDKDNLAKLCGAIGRIRSLTARRRPKHKDDHK